MSGGQFQITFNANDPKKCKYMPKFGARLLRIDALIDQQKQKSHCNDYFIDLACSIRRGEYWSRSFFGKFMDLACGSVSVEQSVNLKTNGWTSLITWV